MLAELMRLKYGIAVAGAHGKTTTTSMVAAVLAAAGLDPTFVVGGRVNHAGTTARLGRGEYMVVEADESDRTFLLLAPVVAVVTTIDREHLDHVQIARGDSGNLHAIRQSRAVLRRGCAVSGRAQRAGHHPARDAPGDHLRHFQPGRSGHQRDRATGLAQQFPADLSRRRPGHVSTCPARREFTTCATPPPPPPWRSISMCPADLIRAGFEKFTGVGRRFEIKGTIDGITLIDDYGHHPVEIRATLEAARGCHFDRVLVLFQPHRYTRTQHLWDEFCRAFNQADMLVLTDIYAASETPIRGITAGGAGGSHSRGGPQERRLPQHDAGRHRVSAERGAPGDAVLAIGAGNVNRALGELAVTAGRAQGFHPKLPSHHAN